MCLDLLIRPKIETPRNISCRKISTMVNSILQKRNEVDKLNRLYTLLIGLLVIIKKNSTVKHRRIRKTFYLSEEQMNKSVKFCQDMIW